MKSILTIILSFLLVVSGSAQTRNVVVGTNDVIVSPTNFWNANSSNARTGLGLGSAATNSSSSFQPASSVLSNLASGGSLTFTNVTVGISNVANLQTSLDEKLSITGNAINLTNFPSSLLRINGSAENLTNFPINLLRTTGDASGLTNFPILNQNTTGTASNVTGVVAITNGGSGATTASGARTAFGLGTAATNPASAFQPSSTILTNLSSSNGGGLTNIASSSLVGTVALASNITGTAALASNITGVVALANGGTGATNASGARTALGVGASDVFVGLTNLGSGGNLGFSSSPYILGSTNSTAPNNAVSALGASTVRDLIGALAINGSAAGLTNFPASLLTTNGNGAGLTNLTAANITGTVALASNITGIIAISNGGTGATNASTARSNLELGSASTNPASAFQPASSVLTNLASSNGFNITNIQASNIVGITHSNNVQNFVIDVSNATNTVTNSRNVTVYSISPSVNLITNTIQLPTSNAIAGDLARIIHTGPTNSLTRVRKIGETTNLVTFNQTSESAGFIYDGTNWLVLPNNSQIFPIYFSGTNASNNTAISRTNLGLGATWLTNTNVTNFRTAVGLGATNNSFSRIGGVNTNEYINLDNAEFYGGPWTFDQGFALNGDIAAATTRTNLGLPLTALTNVNITNFRTDIGLGWSALTNSNAGTGLVSVDSNGFVVSPTNFWQSAPIASNLQTIVQTFSPTTNSTNAATNARNVYVYSLATNVSGITNTVTLPTNAATINGDNITVIHQGLTNTTTAIRKLGQTNNLITINKFDEAVKFIYENGDWAFYHNISFIDPIQFSGTNASVNAAASRTNLGLGATNDVTFKKLNLDALYFNNINFAKATNNSIDAIVEYLGVELMRFTLGGLVFNDSNFGNGTRSSLGLGATNQVTFGRLYISNTNVGAFEGLANLINSNNTTISNETLFRVGLAEATNRSAQFGFRTVRTNNGGEGFATFSVFGYNALMMIGPSDRSRTNTATNAGIEADIFSISETNRVATLIDTNTGAFTLHRPIGFRTNETNASPATGNTFGDRARWLQINVGTNTFYIPLFQ